MPGELGDQLPREGDGLVGRRVGHPERGTGRNLPPAGDADDVACRAGGDRDREADRALEIFRLNYSVNTC